MNYYMIDGEFYETDELYHHGIKGQKWGVRRYQNPDGTLTAKGKKRYGRMSDNKLQKTLYKQVRIARSEQTDWSNQWNVSATIGKHSKAAQEKFDKARLDAQSSSASKQADKKWSALDKKFDRGEIGYDEYMAEYEKIRATVYDPKLDSSVRFSSKGRVYSKAYLDTYGKDLNIAYLRDLGYNQSVAEEFTERILKANKKLLNGM